ncbi:C-type lectin domain family 4 member E-like [Esox lucius]|uniref:C-type lectin domain family 4 member E n=1 Tax=Esox lucius TaxID=8010 RepID=C1BX79_ESOLU|nr:C-type lectin domain family 4 member E-like [Esox lucius]ACO13632.1 C-type lectin domain family 4 member E [Esox lucius]
MMRVTEASSTDQDCEQGYVTKQDIRESSGPAQHSGTRVYILVGVSFGLLCVLQVTLNVSLNLVYSYKNVTDLRQTTYNTLLCKKDICKACPQDWKRFGCSCYYISTVLKSWTDSRQDCLDRGGDLVIINSREEQAFIKSFNYRAWIGLSGREVKRSWRWVDGTPLTTSYWEDGEPNNAGGEEDSVLVRRIDVPLAAWNDVSCDHENSFICEGTVGEINQ